MRNRECGWRGTWGQQELQADTPQNTHPGQGWPQWVNSAFGGCFVVSVTRTHDVLKKARTNLEVRKPVLPVRATDPAPNALPAVVRVCR